jgi:hypothetical protein
MKFVVIDGTPFTFVYLYHNVMSHFKSIKMSVSIIHEDEFKASFIKYSVGTDVQYNSVVMKTYCNRK